MVTEPLCDLCHVEPVSRAGQKWCDKCSAGWGQDLGFKGLPPNKDATIASLRAEADRFRTLLTRICNVFDPERLRFTADSDKVLADCREAIGWKPEETE